MYEKVKPNSSLLLIAELSMSSDIVVAPSIAVQGTSAPVLFRTAPKPILAGYWAAGLAMAKGRFPRVRDVPTGDVPVPK